VRICGSRNEDHVSKATVFSRCGCHPWVNEGDGVYVPTPVASLTHTELAPINSSLTYPHTSADHSLTDASCGRRSESLILLASWLTAFDKLKLSKMYNLC